MHDFELHPQLAADTVEVTRLPLCRVLLMNDANYPWLILVPQRPDLCEIFELNTGDQIQLAHESSRIARLMHAHFKADKMNIAALGNRVPQLHIHHIVRYTTDLSWPAPIFGAHPARTYPDALLEQRRNELHTLITL